jgi:hypothetical protein
MRNILTHTSLLVIALTVMIMAAGRDRTINRYNANFVKKSTIADTISSFDARYFIKPLSRRFY